MSLTENLHRPTKAVSPDRRRIEYVSAPDLRDAAAETVSELRRVELRLAGLLREIEKGNVHVEAGASSVEHLGTRLGLDRAEARRYRDLGRAVEIQPSVGERVAALALPTPRAALLAPVLDGSGEPRDDFDREMGYWPEWILVAEELSTRKLRERVRREKRLRETGETITDMRFHVTGTTFEHFERARVLASRKAGRRLTNDQTFDVVVDDYVERHDPLLVDDGTRRVGATSEIKGERYIPAKVRRDVRRRAGCRCEFPGCPEETFLEFAHRVPHRDQTAGLPGTEGCGREVDDLFLLCWLHHTMLDGDHVTVLGPTADPTWVGPFRLAYRRDRPGGYEPETVDELRAVLRVPTWQRSFWVTRADLERRLAEAEAEANANADASDQDARGPP